MSLKFKAFSRHGSGHNIAAGSWEATVNGRLVLRVGHDTFLSGKSFRYMEGEAPNRWGASWDEAPDSYGPSPYRWSRHAGCIAATRAMIVQIDDPQPNGGVKRNGYLEFVFFADNVHFSNNVVRFDVIGVSEDFAEIEKRVHAALAASGLPPEFASPSLNEAERFKLLDAAPSLRWGSLHATA